MAPLAPRETGAPGGDAPRVAAATHPCSPPAADLRRPPLTRSGLPLARQPPCPPPPRGVVARPGALMQEVLLRDFHVTAVPGAVAPSPHCSPVWITPPFHASRFTSSYISSVLSFLLTAPPDLVRVMVVTRSVFRARVSNGHVANFLIAHGFLEFNRFRFYLHSTEAQALVMANELKEEDTCSYAKPPTNPAQAPRHAPAPTGADLPPPLPRPRGPSVWDWA